MGEYCGAKTRAGAPCRRPAGWGTRHPGAGRCKLHWGRLPGGTGLPGNKNARKHKTYETVIRDRLTKEDLAVLDLVPDRGDLRQELRTLRFKLLRLLEPVERQMVVGTAEGAEIVTLKVNEVTKAYAIEKLVDGIRKIAKDMKETDGLLALVDAIERSRKKAEQDGV